jgi:hypothetical protein
MFELRVDLLTEVSVFGLFVDCGVQNENRSLLNFEFWRHDRLAGK